MCVCVCVCVSHHPASAFASRVLTNLHSPQEAKDVVPLHVSEVVVVGVGCVSNGVAGGLRRGVQKDVNGNEIHNVQQHKHKRLHNWKKEGRKEGRNRVHEKLS